MMNIRYLANGLIKVDLFSTAKELEYIFRLANKSGLNNLIESLLRPYTEMYDLVDASKLNEFLSITEVRVKDKVKFITHNDKLYITEDNLTFILHNNGFDYRLFIDESLVILVCNSSDGDVENVYQFDRDKLTDYQKDVLDNLVSRYTEDTKDVEIAIKLFNLDASVDTDKYDYKVVCEIRYDGRDYVSEFFSPKFLLVNGLMHLICYNLKLAEKGVS